MSVYLPGGTQCYLIALIAVTALFGDYLVSHSRLQLYKAVFDNATHATIGGLSWLIVCIHYKNPHNINTLLEIFLCTLISSAIDLDHFIAAKSVKLSDATNLQTRPFLHCSTLPLVFSSVGLMVTSNLGMKWMQRVVLICFTAFATHHTRDATRRGYWIAPFGCTSPIPYFAYIAITVCIPHLICFAAKHLSVERAYKYTNIIV